MCFQGHVQLVLFVVCFALYTVNVMSQIQTHDVLTIWHEPLRAEPSRTGERSSNVALALHGRHYGCQVNYARSYSRFHDGPLQAQF